MHYPDGPSEWIRVPLSATRSISLLMRLPISFPPPSQSAGLNADGKLHMELAATGLGTAWVVERLAAIKAAHDPIGILVGGSGPAAALLPDLKKAGLVDQDYAGESTGTLAKASQMLLDKVTNGEVVHRGETPLMLAVEGCFRKPHGDGGFLWNRMSSSTDISPLVAGTLALWGFVNHPDKVAVAPWFAWD
jgi:hypothetical protein